MATALSARETQLVFQIMTALTNAYDSAEIRPAFASTLDKLADVLAKYERSDVTIVGHTDSTGSEEYNQRLSEARAYAVEAVFVDRGIPAYRIDIEGRGESEPRADNATEAGRQLNRRVEILVRPEA